jgi:VWFA-related protein
LNPAEVRRRLEDIFTTANNVLLALVDVEKPKALVWVSRGFVTVSKALTEWRSQYDPVTESSRRSNAPIYFVNLRGLEQKPNPWYRDVSTGIMLPSRSTRLSRNNVMEALAWDTGGFVVRNPDNASRAVEEMRAVYLIGYYPENTKRDGKFRKTNVKVRRKGLKVRSRKGYYAPLEGEVPSK